MANSIAKAFKKKKTDELYTPIILIEPLKKHLEAWATKFYKLNSYYPTVLAPFDTEDSEYVKLMTEWGKGQWKVKYGHIATGQDFFTYDYGEWDLCVSNPPFSLKKKIYEHLYELKKPFCLLGNVMQLNYMEIGNMFADNPIQLLLFDKRVSFNGNPSSFASGYFCNRFLKKDLIFEHLPHCNSGKDYVPSSMYKGSFTRDLILYPPNKIRTKVAFEMPMQVSPMNAKAKKLAIKYHQNDGHSVAMHFKKWMNEIEKHKKDDN